MVDDQIQKADSEILLFPLCNGLNEFISIHDARLVTVVSRCVDRSR